MERERRRRRGRRQREIPTCSASTVTTRLDSKSRRYEVKKTNLRHELSLQRCSTHIHSVLYSAPLRVSVSVSVSVCVYTDVGFVPPPLGASHVTLSCSHISLSRVCARFVYNATRRSLFMSRTFWYCRRRCSCSASA